MLVVVQPSSCGEAVVPCPLPGLQVNQLRAEMREADLTISALQEELATVKRESQHARDVVSWQRGSSSFSFLLVMPWSGWVVKAG